MSRGAIAAVVERHFVRYKPAFECTCGWKPSVLSSVVWRDWTNHFTDALLAAMPSTRGVDAAEDELGALLERLAEESYEVMFRKFTGEMAGMIGPYGAFSVGFVEEPRKDIIGGGATPLAALQALEAALAEQQDSKEPE